MQEEQQWPIGLTNSVAQTTPSHAKWRQQSAYAARHGLKVTDTYLSIP